MIFSSVSGNLGKDAEIRDTKAGPICSFSVASEARNGHEKVTTWVNCALFGNRGEALCRYLTKGSKVTVHGVLKQREYNGKTYLDLKVSELMLMGGGPRNTPAQRSREPAAEPATTPGGGYSDADFNGCADIDEYPF